MIRHLALLTHFLVAIAGVSLMLSGCSKLSKFRQSREETVAAAELGSLPQVHEPAPTRPRLSHRPRSTRPPVRSARPRWETVGNSVQGRPIELMRIGTGPLRVLFVGGIHGDEPEGLPLIENFARELADDADVASTATVWIVRDLNPDGTAARTRTNANGVDLNRNFPASNWNAQARAPQFHPGPEPASEPETQILVQIIRDMNPDRILVMHSTRGKPMVNYDGPARQLAEQMSELNKYVTSDTIGYPTPGSLGSYAGKDLNLPIITLELPRGIDTDQAWAANRDSMHQFLR